MPSAFQFPLIDETTECALLVLPLPLLPFALGALGQLQARDYWQTDADWHAAYEAIAEIEANAMQSCLSDLIESNRQLYRLLDAALYGREYSVASTEPLEITPAIPDVPDTTATETGIVSMLDNLPGIINPGWFGVGGQKATLADIVRGLSTGKESVQTDLWDSIQDILDAGGDAGEMVDAVGELVTGTAETVADGGIFVAVLASIVANTAMSRAQLVMLQHILRALNGGNIVLPPADNLLQALRGDTPASGERNVIDSVGNQGVIDKLDDLLIELGQNTTDNAEIIAKLESIREELE